MYSNTFFTIILIFLQYVHHISTDDIIFDISNYNPNNRSTQIHKKFVKFSKGLNEIQINNKPDDSGFFIIQIHTFIDNITLSSNINTTSRRFEISGSNIGLVSDNSRDSNFFVQTLREITGLIIVIVYGVSDPIPGGCNLSFDTPIAPYLKAFYTDEVIIVEGQPPIAPGTTCEEDKVNVELYHLYMQENYHDVDSYYENLEKMITVDSIRTNGRKVSAAHGFMTYKKYYNSYKGLGQVFAMIATYNNTSAAYVPTVSYGCNLQHVGEDCYGPVTLHWKVICAILLIFGLFTNFYGHKFFKITVYSIGFIVGVCVSYVLFSIDETLAVSDRTTTSLVIGVIYATFWLFLWYHYGTPILSTSLTYFLTGYLLASIVFYAGLSDVWIFHNDLLYWMLHISITLGVTIILIPSTKYGHIFACNILGSYASILALNYYTGGNLQYILINSFRRIVIKSYNTATIDAPFQMLDIIQTVLWTIMVTFGFYYQVKEQRGRPPFPPPRFIVVVENENNSERTPLLRNILRNIVHR